MLCQCKVNGIFIFQHVWPEHMSVFSSFLLNYFSISVFIQAMWPYILVFQLISRLNIR